MNDKPKAERRHESVDHVDPTDAGMMDPDPDRQPATGVMGDETLIRRTGGGIPPYPGVDGNEDRHGGSPHPGPTQWQNENDESWPPDSDRETCSGSRE